MIKETDKGVLKYRMPNILEIYDILDSSGIYDKEKKSQLRIKGNVLKSMGFLIDFSGIEGVESYEQLLEDADCMMVPLASIADEVMLKTFDVFKKKSSLEMPSQQPSIGLIETKSEISRVVKAKKK